LHGKIKRQRLTFAFRSPAPALAASLPHQDHIWITADQLPVVRFHKIEPDEMLCQLDFTENLLSFEKYPTPP